LFRASLQNPTLLDLTMRFYFLLPIIPNLLFVTPASSLPRLNRLARRGGPSTGLVQQTTPPVLRRDRVYGLWVKVTKDKIHPGRPAHSGFIIRSVKDASAPLPPNPKT